MCGIAGIILKQRGGLNISEAIVAMANAIRHRGPDGEGFATAAEDRVTPYFNTLRQNYTRQDLKYIPATPLSQAPDASFLAFAHRRLSIIDLSEGGHQPMCDISAKLWMTFNGEIYNYIELKETLLRAGHRFVSESDSEVILAAYKEWGTDCVNYFNGMWSFCIYDAEKKICFASRDRLGVKPFYYVNNAQLLAFASEQKAFVASGLISAEPGAHALHNYLISGQTETSPSNFFKEVYELFPGHNLLYQVNTQEILITRYYHLQDHITLENDDLSEAALIEKIRESFEHSVKLRLRSDVEVGTCLSGGIDSSALAVTMSEISRHPVYCFTSVFHNQAFNEEHFADSVAKKISAKHFKTEPSLQGFLAEADDLIYAQDVPIWDTSTYAQHKVMQLAKDHGIKVVLDGQGADEIFAGYHHHFYAQWQNLMRSANYFAAAKEMRQSAKTIANPFLFYVKERVKQNYYFQKKEFSQFFKNDFIKSHDLKNPLQHAGSVNEALLSDIYQTRLKSFLKCEDRCGMWHSVESRTPFSDDVELINLMFSFNGNKKIKNGTSKYLLREAVKNKLPKEIYMRYDKKGFETPMQQWMKAMRPQLLSEIRSANFEFVDYKKLEHTDPSNSFHNKLLFKLFVLGRWQKVFKEGRS